MKCPRCDAMRPETKAHWPLCAVCKRQYDKEWRAKRKAEGRPVVSTKMPREYNETYKTRYRSRLDVKAHEAEFQREYVTRPHVMPKVRARRETRNAMRRGELQRQSCEACGSPRTHAHHDDYGKPLIVRWLCRKHHEQEHHAKAEAQP